MLESILLRFTESPDLYLPANGITVFVGPNNSGKSLVLREVERAVTENPFPADLKILKNFDVTWPSEKEVEAGLAKYDRYRNARTPSQNVVFGRVNPNGGLETAEVGRDSLFHLLRTRDKGFWATHVVRWGVVRLDGRYRFSLTNDQPGGDLLSAPNTLLAHLFQNDEARKEVRALLKEAFQLNFVIDPTNLGTLRIRLSPEEPLVDEQSLNEAAREYHKNAIHVKDASDGVQAYTGIVSAVLAGEFHTILIDEPEAFLHPPLARKLGKALATIATRRGGGLLASTHSADFLWGCVQATKMVRVVRMEYAGGKSRGRMVDADELMKLFQHPLMRSANVASGLFYDGVIVTESDNDRVFYSEIFMRLAAENPDSPSVLFINAQNKQTIQEMLGPLRRFGVPAAAIPDIDVVKDGGATWTRWLSASQVPTALHAGYGQQRAAIATAFEKSGKNMKTEGGVSVLGAGDGAAANHLFDNLAEFGVFVVRPGELENWLPSLGIPGEKTDWTIAALERMGSDPTDGSYINAGSGDVWDFMRTIVKWIRDPARKGMT